MLDSHCHLNDDKLIEDYKKHIEEAFCAGVNSLLVIGWDIESSKKAIQIASEYDSVYAAVGIHPENLDGITNESINEVEQLAKNPKVIAIGEIGLDYHWFKEESHRKKQKEFFIKQIDLANKLNLPVSIHARDAIEDTYEILASHNLKSKGVLHCYSGSVDMMKKFADLGFYFGFDGPITYKNAIVPKECVKFCPLNRILSETDSPYLTPVPFRGEINSPKHIKEIVKCMAEIKGVDPMVLEEKINQNFNTLFHGKRI